MNAESQITHLHSIFLLMMLLFMVNEDKELDLVTLENECH